MNTIRIFSSDDFMQPTSDGEPIRSVVAQSPTATVVAWHVEPGQCIAAHVHPHGQDTWTVLSGAGLYQMHESGTARAIAAGDVAIARAGEVHGVYNPHAVPLRFISVVTPAEAGYERL